MGYLELDLDLSKEVKAMQAEVRNFAGKVIRPAGIELDKLHDPAEVFTDGSVLWDVYKGYQKLGLHSIRLPKEFGGMGGGLDPKTGAILAEELGYGDVGLSVSLAASSMPFYIASMSQDPDLQQLVRDYCEDNEAQFIGCWAITEPEHGSDWVFAVEPDFDDPKCGPELKAVLKGDEYILTGQKAAWVSNGTIATHASVHVGLDPSKGMQGSGLAIVPLDLPGISKGMPLDKIGQRPLNQGEIFFDEVKIPKSYMVIDNPEMMTAASKMILTGANSTMCMTFVGLAQAAYDEALIYSKQRIQGGVPIFEHKNIKLQLFKMFTKIEAIRAYARRLSIYNHKSEGGSAPHAIAGKVLTTQTSFEIASEAISIFGGNGLAKEYPVEKMLRDAKAGTIEDGENNSLSIVGARDLT